MKQIFKIDVDGFYLEPIIFDDESLEDESPKIPENCIEAPLPEGLFKPKWTGSSWAEGATQDYIDSFKAPSQLSDTEVLQQQNSQLLLQLALQEQIIVDIQNLNADVMLQLAQLQSGGVV